MHFAHAMGWGSPRDVQDQLRDMRRAARKMAAAWHQEHFKHHEHHEHHQEAHEAHSEAHSEAHHEGHRGGPHEHRHRGGHRHGWGHPFGPGPFGPPGFMFGRGPGGFGGFGRPRKAKRGDVRAAILALLAEEPRNGYQIIQEIAERSQGGWKPSPGAVYPALQQLTDEGLVRAEEAEGRKTFQLTEAGLAYIAEHPDEVRAPWEEMTPDVGDNVYELFDLSRQAAAALFQIAQGGSEGQLRQAKQILAETRRKLYQVLADGDPRDE